MIIENLKIRKRKGVKMSYLEITNMEEGRYYQKVYMKCNICKGHGTYGTIWDPKSMKDKTIKCPNCDGEGVIQDWVLWHNPKHTLKVY